MQPKTLIRNAVGTMIGVMAAGLVMASLSDVSLVDRARSGFDS